MCTSRAPASFRQAVLSLSWVPRTMESSQKSTRLSLRIDWLWISFIFATRSRISCREGVKERGQVGVYLEIARW